MRTGRTGGAVRTAKRAQVGEQTTSSQYRERQKEMDDSSGRGDSEACSCEETDKCKLTAREETEKEKVA